MAVSAPDVAVANAVDEYIDCGVGDFKQVCHYREYLIRIVSLQLLISVRHYYHDALKRDFFDKLGTGELQEQRSAKSLFPGCVYFCLALPG